MSLVGTWENEFGSIMRIEHVNEDGTFTATYSSHTGATGVYRVMGIADPDPVGGSQTVAFAVSWHSVEGKPDPSWHWVSGFAGQLQTIDGQEIMSTTYLLQKNTEPQDNWGSTIVATAKFVKQR
jgi:hypothetical protein